MSDTGDDRANRVLWNDVPAPDWLAAFPVGNGRIGGMVFGRTATERIALNDERLWRGVTRERTTPDVAHRLADIRALMFGGDLGAGAALAEEVLGGHQRRIMPYQPVGDLLIDMADTEVNAGAGYRRELDLITGVASTRWSANGATITMRTFVSAVHSVLVSTITTSDPAGTDATVRLDRRRSDERPGLPPSPWVSPEDITLSQWSASDRCGLVGQFPEGISFAAEARILADGSEGTVQTPDPGVGRVDVRGATSITVRIAIATRIEELVADPRQAVSDQLDATPCSISTHLASSRSTATSAAPPRSPRCRFRATGARSGCCPRCHPPGRPDRFPASGRAARSPSKSPGAMAR